MLSTYVYLLYYVCIAVFTLDAGLLARSQNSEGPATDHLDTGFFWGGQKTENKKIKKKIKNEICGT